MFNGQKIDCELLVVGAGVTGAASTYIATKYTNLKHIVVIEKFHDAALVNSSMDNNAQTLHEGDTETNYSLPKARKVQFAGKLIRSYIQKKQVEGLYEVVSGMVIGVGKTECDLLRNRQKEFVKDYPDLRIIYGDTISQVEPAIMSGRKKVGHDDICALYTPNRVCMNYQIYARELFKDAQAVPGKKVEIHYNSAFETITPILNANGTVAYYQVTTVNGLCINAKFVEFAAGAYSLEYAHGLGLGLRMTMINVGGNFYWIGREIWNKNYTVQRDNIPFAAFHIDRNIVTGKGQLGPTTQIIFMMIRRDYSTVRDYLNAPMFTTWEGIRAFERTVRKNNLAWYGIKNILFTIPYLGKYMVLQEARKIIPDLQMHELGLIEGHGGSRPQIIDLDAENPLIMGDCTVVGDRVIANTTPSPGATVSMKNGLRDVLKIVESLKDDGFTFYMDEFKKDFGVTDAQIAAYAH